MDLHTVSGASQRPHGVGDIKVVFAVERFSSVYEEAQELLRLHWEEIAPYPDLFKLNPNKDYYRFLEQQNVLVVVTARASEKLVGYILLMVSRHPHYHDVFVATDDIHFLHPDYRKGLTGVRMIRYAEAQVKDRASVMFLRCKTAHNHGAIFERMGYEAMDVVYSKRLGDK